MNNTILFKKPISYFTHLPIGIKYGAISFIVLLLMATQTRANLNQEVTINVQKASFKAVMAQIHKQTGYSANLDYRHLSIARPITITLKKAPLQDALDSIFKTQPFSYKIKDKIITTVDRQENTSQTSQTETIHGQVIGPSSEPLSGATIRVKGKKTATTSDENGNFYLPVKIGDSFTITYIGYLQVTVKVEENYNMEISQAQTQYKGDVVQQGTLINVSDRHVLFTLVPEAYELDEVNVVNTGYQRISRDRSAGSYAKADMDVFRNRIGTSNVLQRLDGLIPGLTINNSPADYKRNSILIRGLSTINANAAPLVVIDGIPSDRLSTLNPQDIADITVLKDAVSTSIWGARASNGVIVVSTKKGAREDRIKINYSSYINLQGKPDLNYLKVMNSKQYIDLSRETFDPNLWSYNQASTYNVNIRTGITPDRQILYDMHRNAITQERGEAMLDSLSRIDNRAALRGMYNNAYTQNHTLSFSGGAAGYTFYNSLAFTESKDSKPGSSDRTYSFNLRQDYQFNSAIKGYLITDLDNTLSRANNSITPDNNFIPYQLFRNASGRPLDMNYMGYLSERFRPEVERATGINLRYNPIENAGTGFDRQNTVNLRLNAGLNIDIYKGIRYEGVFGFNRSTYRSRQYNDAKTNYQQRFKVAAFYDTKAQEYNLPNYGGNYRVNNQNAQDWTVRNQLIYDKSWSDSRHQLTVMAGHELQAYRSTNNRSQAYGYDLKLQTHKQLDWIRLIEIGAENTFIPYNIEGSTLKSESADVGEALYFEESETETRYRSYYSTAGYTYDHRYSLNVSWRNDQSNLFGNSSRAKRKPVWAVGGKWNLNEESWMQDVVSINELAIRTSYGVTGNAPNAGAAASYDLYRAGNSTGVPGGQFLYLVTPANPNLSWEPTYTLNLGLDYAILGQRLSGSLEYYNRKTKDLLSEVPVNPQTGHISMFGNYGDISNKGFELTVQSVNLENEFLSWQTTLNLGYNKSVLNYSSRDFPIVIGADKIRSLYIAGVAAFPLYSYRYAGLNAQGNPVVYRKDGSTSEYENDVSADDVIYSGTYQQPWSGGLQNSFRYKDFSLSLNIIFNLGHKMRGDNIYFNQFQGVRPPLSALNFNVGNYASAVARRWQKPGDEHTTDVPAYIINSQEVRFIDAYTNRDRNIQDASFVKLRDVTFSYNIPERLLSRYHLQQLQFSVSFSNLMLWKANRLGIDPEFHDTYTGKMSMPSGQKKFGFALNLSF